MKGTGKNAAFLWFIILLGAIAGSLIGDALGNSFSVLKFLKNSYEIGMKEPLSLSFKIMTITLGINFNANIMTIIGVIVAIILYRRY
ncbi:MAG: DUF4321 domain-containing protein [Clostridium sp.]|uniref:DUF4321 domain-containing protein n=1 Tax=Clostridium sp. TaxID=1506 RepID=UPI0025BD1616|nr:DUF4321 domain-containing protein [Clostridium sp.]MCH3964739.1 DUF4321 domain-containing protein [Clostridium sp.]MCI1715210.1 DUF4321 domain-containing protein [Clostridium sp.]MCI1799472.1 DUF4321 domain-containing protein [Clostridium sp.]MCI1813393.1 DUF4321 domain-containing protein [Clostridium sp.]MCI1870284.1 DUF4321 domain-containing protein [Clostridium sp.]